MPLSSRESFVRPWRVHFSARNNFAGPSVILPPLGLFLAALCAFGPILGNDFVAWDDDDNFLRNPQFRGLGLANVTWAWTTFHLGVYQPLAWMLFEAQYAAGGLDPRTYHLTSLLLHGVVGAAVYILAVRLVRRAAPDCSPKAIRTACALAAAVFALHPLRAEVVAWVSCQGYLSCALFSVLAVLAYERSRPPDSPPRAGWFLASVLLFACGLLCHATAIGLPLVLLVLDAYPLRRRPGLGPVGRRVLLEKWPFVLAAAACCVLAFLAKGRSVRPLGDFGPETRLAQAAFGTIFYLARTLVPFGLHAHHPLTSNLRLAEPVFLVSLMLASGLTILAIGGRRKWPGFAAAWLAYLAILAPNSGLVTFGHQLVADRYSYLSTVPWSILAAGLLARMIDRHGRLVLAVALPVLLGLGALSWSQSRTWRDSTSLWSNVLAWDDSSPAAHLNLGNLLSRQGRLDEAFHHYQMAAKYDPSSPDPYFNSAVLLAKKQLFGEVDHHLAEAKRRGLPAHEADAWLGMVLSDQGRDTEALLLAERAFRRAPGSVRSLVTYGKVLARQGRLEEAVTYLSRAVAIDPRLQAPRLTLGLALLDLSRLDEAARVLRDFLRFAPDSAEGQPSLRKSCSSSGTGSPRRATSKRRCGSSRVIPWPGGGRTSSAARPENVASRVAAALADRPHRRTGPTRHPHRIPAVAACSHGLNSNLAHCAKNARGFSKTTFRIRPSSCPRRRISKMNSGTASGSLCPQSPAELTMTRSAPNISTMSAARAGVHLVIG
jgi:tetratricopeptide (TPR) repeat protein